jgi:glycosyltransferase involved in cell wall biosynthesis
MAAVTTDANKRRICYVASGVDLGDDSTSPIIHVVEAVDALVELGCDVVLIGGYSRVPSYLKSEWRGHLVSPSAFFRRASDPWRLVNQLRLLRRESPPGVMYIRWGNTAPVASLFALICKIPFWVEMNGIYSLVRTEGKRPCRRALLAWFMRWLEKLFMRRAAGIFTTTPEMANYYTAAYQLNPARVIPNACGVNVRTHIPTMSPYRRRVMGAGPVVGYAGGLWKQTGFDLLVEAAPLVARQFSDVRFKVAGTSSIADQFIQRAKELGCAPAFAFVGKVPYYQISDFLQEVDVAVAPYRDSESLSQIGGGTPQKIFSYLACGKPTIITDLPYYQRFRVCPACFFFRDGDADDLARVVNCVIRLEPERALRLSKSARSFALEHFAWNRNARCIVDTLEKAHEISLRGPT